MLAIIRRVFVAVAVLFGPLPSAALAACPYSPQNGPWYWSVGDSSPATQVWAGDAGAFVALADGTYTTWTGLGCSATFVPTQATLQAVIAEIALKNYLMGAGYGSQQIAGSNNVTLTNPLAGVYGIALDTAGKHIILPKMNLPLSRPLGVAFEIANNGSAAFDLADSTGSPMVNTTVYPGQVMMVYNHSFASTSGVIYTSLKMTGPGFVVPAGSLMVGDGVRQWQPLVPTGDVTVNGSAVTAIGANKVANSQIRQSGALSVIGRSANSTGNVADIACTAAGFGVLRESGSALGCGALDLGQAGVTGTLAAGRFPALTGDVTTSAGSLATTLAAGSASVLNSGTLQAGRMPALTGEVTTSAGAVATTLAKTAITNRTEDTAPDGAADFLLTYDASADALKKVLLHRATAFKVGSFTRDLTTASGNQAVTGVGFKPKAIILLASTNLGAATLGGVGIWDCASGMGNFLLDSSAGLQTTQATIVSAGPGGFTNYQYASTGSCDSDGFTLTWIKNNSPTGTATLYYLALR